MRKVLILGILILFVISALVGCRRVEHEISIGNGDGAYANYAEGEELLCLVETQEKAQEIADMYGIQLVSFTQGVATFHTDQDPMNVINMGKEKGYPALELNQISTIY